MIKLEKTGEEFQGPEEHSIARRRSLYSHFERIVLIDSQLVPYGP